MVTSLVSSFSIYAFIFQMWHEDIKWIPLEDITKYCISDFSKVAKKLWLLLNLFLLLKTEFYDMLIANDYTIYLLKSQISLKTQNLKKKKICHSIPWEKQFPVSHEYFLSYVCFHPSLLTVISH